MQHRAAAAAAADEVQTQCIELFASLDSFMKPRTER